MPNDIVLSMRNISKSFPGVRALHNVDFTLNKGEIHALMGENGAGKSTLIKVLTGVYPKDAGQIQIGDCEKEAHIKSPQDAQNLGISTVYQEITLCPNLTVAENMFIGRGNYRFVNWQTMRTRTSEILDKLNIPARDPAAGDVFSRRAADGRHCARRRYGMQGADSRRADLFAR